MKKIQLIILLTAVLIPGSSLAVYAGNYELLSPDGRIKVNISSDRGIHFSVTRGDELIVRDASADMILNGMPLAGDVPGKARVKTIRIEEVFKPVVPVKSSSVRNECNELLLSFRGRYAIRFRAYDDGIAYRFETSFREQLVIDQEKLDLHFAGDFTAYYPEEESLQSHYERTYQVKTLSAVGEGSFCSLPLLLMTGEESSMLITEADLYDYPGLFLEKKEDGLAAKFPGVVLESVPRDGSGDRNETIISEADYIAMTAGSRTFPWRVFVLADRAADLVESDMVLKLSSPLALDETGWIKPGKVAWDWWNALNIHGVDFESGINNNTYKYYIDFAAEYGLEYIILDEGWSESTTKIMDCAEDINVRELVEYGRSKNVGVILWVLWKPLDMDMEKILDLYREWGVKGIKVDFMQRADQYMVNYYERVAREAARRELLVDYHGAFKPAGLRRAYPNVINYEGFKGMENCKWSADITPEHDLTLPFTRMVAGPMDFTPGAMDNATEENFAPRFTRPMSQGTRCHQVAMYVLYESPLQMLSDTPSNYYRERETTDFIARIPTTWDESKVLHARVGDFLVMARRNDESWYLGAMTDWSTREFEIDLSFLPEGSYDMEIMEDGINADKIAKDYIKRKEQVEASKKISIKLAPGGGWAAIITPR
ncbi:MAG: glycoside hydrolase family 97 protein [Bacteroidales bacterium]|nr:glycoside hydrolase family 97 protein [Bacteroidales bacterium]